MKPADHDPTFEQIRQKVEAGRRLSPEDGLWLYRPEVDLHAVGELADIVRQRKNGNRAYYNVNSHLNPTNVCIYRCGLCAFSCDPGDSGAYVMTDDEIVALGCKAADEGCTELHIVGGLHPDKTFDWYRSIIQMLHKSCAGLHLKAFTAAEIARFSELSGLSIRAVLETLIDDGLNSLPGGGAEIFSPNVREQICPLKVDAETWLEVHRTAHSLGLRSNATMLYGHVETLEDRIDHIVRLRELQDETAGFQAFIPLAFHPRDTALAAGHPHIEKSTGIENLRTVAVSRLMLDNFDHIKAYWISLGVGIAQAALAYGADDLDGTVGQEEIHHTAGSTSPEILTIETLRHLIEETGREPVERDTLYRPVKRDGADWWVVVEG
ncbi:MAG: aminofutalosine synthase MqnE [Pirellulales bacterium]|nr:aminofutalosine synthase MqnE [Pirellulales bacterium]